MPIACTGALNVLRADRNAPWTARTGLFVPGGLIVARYLVHCVYRCWLPRKAASFRLSQRRGLDISVRI